MNEDKSVKELFAHNEIGHILWTLWSNRHVLDGNYACCQVRILLESAERAAEHIGQHFRDCQSFMRTFSSHAPRPTLTQSEYFISFKKYFFVYWNKDSISEHVCKVMYLKRWFQTFISELWTTQTFVFLPKIWVQLSRHLKNKGMINST